MFYAFESNSILFSANGIGYVEQYLSEGHDVYYEGVQESDFSARCFWLSESEKLFYFSTPSEWDTDIRQYHYEEKDGVIFVKDESGNYIYELKRINPYKMLINDEVFYCANKKMNYTTTEGFYTLSEVKESYSFQKQTMSDEVYGDVIFMGKYELCKSGTESYKEIAIFDLGEKGECTLKIFRYNDGQIFELGSYNGDGTYDSILFNKQGSIIESNGYNENQIVLEYYEISGENVFKIEVDHLVKR